jgi:hypothetical protein
MATSSLPEVRIGVVIGSRKLGLMIVGYCVITIGKWDHQCPLDGLKAPTPMTRESYMPRPHKNSEHILIWQKGMEPLEDINHVGNDLSSENAQWFSRTCKTITNVKPKNSDHPCPFNPVLPYEYVQLFTRKDDIVIDPFSGEATTCWVSKLCGRHYAGIDMVDAYVKRGRDSQRAVSRDVGLLDNNVAKMLSTCQAKGR